MTPEQSAAYIMSQSACALIEAFGMMSENMQRVHRGESLAYLETAFADIIERYGIYYNSVSTVLRQ